MENFDVDNNREKKRSNKKICYRKGDTGSPQVQIAILTERINNLTGHFLSLIHI